MDALLAFAAAIVSLRLAAELVRRRPSPGRLAWAASLAAFGVASAALAWGAAAGWSEAPFRVYYLCGGLLTAFLLGAGSLLRVGLRWVAPVALLYAGLAAGIALSEPLTAAVSGDAIPPAGEHFDLFPARVLAIVGNLAGTLAAVAVALATVRRRPLGNALLLAGIGVAAIGSAVAGLGEGGSALFALVAAVLLYAGFVAPARPSLVVAHLRGRALSVTGPAALAQPHVDEERAHAEREDRLRDRAVDAAVGDQPRESSHNPPAV